MGTSSSELALEDEDFISNSPYSTTTGTAGAAEFDESSVWVPGLTINEDAEVVILRRSELPLDMISDTADNL